MFLSDKLQSIYEESGQFDLETCNKIIHAIKDKVMEETEVYINIAKKRGFINSRLLYSGIQNVENVWNVFAKKHPEIPDVLISKIKENMNNYRKVVRNHETKAIIVKHK